MVNDPLASFVWIKRDPLLLFARILYIAQVRPIFLFGYVLDDLPKCPTFHIACVLRCSFVCENADTEAIDWKLAGGLAHVWNHQNTSFKETKGPIRPKYCLMWKTVPINALWVHEYPIWKVTTYQFLLFLGNRNYHQYSLSSGSGGFKIGPGVGPLFQLIKIHVLNRRTFWSMQ